MDNITKFDRFCIVPIFVSRLICFVYCWIDKHFIFRFTKSWKCYEWPSQSPDFKQVFVKIHKYKRPFILLKLLPIGLSIFVSMCEKQMKICLHFKVTQWIKLLVVKMCTGETVVVTKCIAYWLINFKLLHQIVIWNTASRPHSLTSQRSPSPTLLQNHCWHLLWNRKERYIWKGLLE